MHEPVKARIVMPEDERADVVLRLSEADIERIAEAVLRKLRPVLASPETTPTDESAEYFSVKRNPPSRLMSEY